jgi:hypothetical protein
LERCIACSGFAFLGHVLEHPYGSLRQFAGIDCTPADSAPETRSILALQLHHPLDNLPTPQIGTQTCGPTVRSYSSSGGRQTPGRLTDQFIGTIGEQFLKPPVDPDESVLFLDKRDTQAGGSKNRHLLFMRLPKALLGRPPLGDVAQDDHRPHQNASAL